MNWAKLKANIKRAWMFTYNKTKSKGRAKTLLFACFEHYATGYKKAQKHYDIFVPNAGRFTCAHVV